MTMHLVRRSDNRKTGKVALAISRLQMTCPTDCPLMGSGCYGENNGYGGSASLFGRVLQYGKAGIDELRQELARLKAGDTIRVNVVGDYLMDGLVDMDYIDALNTIPETVKVLSYTHAWRKMKPSMFADHVRPQASCETDEDVAKAKAAGWSTVRVVPQDATAGKAEVICPNVTKGIQCVDCGLCAKQRKSTVLFPVHGVQKRKATAAIGG